MKLGVLGAGYVGVVTGVGFAEKGNDVIILDVDESKIKMLSGGKVPFYEPGLEEVISKARENKHLRFTTEIADVAKPSEVIFIAVGTPQKEDNSVDLRYVFNAAEKIGNEIKGDSNFKVVVIKSTVLPGTTKNIENILLKYRERDTFAVASNPEFLKEGTALEDVRSPDRIVLGVENEQAKKILTDLYTPFLRRTNGGRLMYMDRASAELTKYASNGMLAVRIAYMNEIATLAEAVGANIDYVRLGMGLDPRIGPKHLFPGPGYGGSCFPKDVRGLVALAEKEGKDLSILRTVDASNDLQKYWAANKIRDYYQGEIQDKTIALWGVSFKPKTDDIRESPAIYTTERLLEQGARVNVYDPESGALKNFNQMFKDKVTYFNNVFDVLNDAHGVLIITDCDEFKSIDLDEAKSRLKQPVMIDARNLYKLDQMKEKGFEYLSLGRPSIYHSKK